MRLTAALLALCLLSGCATYGSAGDTIQWQSGEKASIFCAALDVASTQVAISGGMGEGNPVMALAGDEWAATTSAVVSVGFHMWLRKIARRYPKQYQTDVWVPVAGLRCAAGAWNTYKIVSER